MLKNILSLDKFTQKINENSTSIYDFGCLMLQIPIKLQDFQNIEGSDIYTEEGDKSYGLEDEPHITILYGLHSNDINDSEIENCIKEFSKNNPTIKGTLKEISCFSNEKYDVLKFDVECDQLHQFNKILKEFPNTNSFPDYHPHLTIGYLQPKSGSKYSMKLDTPFEFESSNIIYSKPNGEKINYNL